MIDKVLQIQKTLGLKDGEFARSIGYKPQSFNQWKTGASPVPAKAIIKIIQKYSEIDANWLIKDKGVVFSDKAALKNTAISTGKLVQEPELEYYTVKKLLAEKDERIVDLKSQLETLKEVISTFQKQ